MNSKKQLTKKGSNNKRGSNPSNFESFLTNSGCKVESIVECDICENIVINEIPFKSHAFCPFCSENGIKSIINFCSGCNHCSTEELIWNPKKKQNRERTRTEDDKKTKKEDSKKKIIIPPPPPPSTKKDTSPRKMIVDKKIIEERINFNRMVNQFEKEEEESKKLELKENIDILSRKLDEEGKKKNNKRSREEEEEHNDETISVHQPPQKKRKM